MKWASALSQNVSTEVALAECVGAIQAQLADEQADLLLVFASPHHRAGYSALPALLCSTFPQAVVLGCGAGGVIGAGKEVEQRPALSVTAARLPGVEIIPFHLVDAELLPEGSAAQAWHKVIGVTDERNPHFIILSDPYTCDAESLIAGLDAAYPQGRKLGGLASAGAEQGQSSLFLMRGEHHGGAVGVALCGNIEVDAVVAQGCRPIGTPLVVTSCGENVLYKVQNRSPIEVLREVYATLDERDKVLFQSSLFIGIEMSDKQIEYHQGDFLIRNIIGVSNEDESLVVGARLSQFEAVQFHLRDARTSAEDLDQKLARYKSQCPSSLQGALLFSCLGRGVHLYGVENHDSDLFRSQLGEVPLGGFFCNGEIGPVAGKTFVHGYTSSFALFREKN